MCTAMSAAQRKVGVGFELGDEAVVRELSWLPGLRHVLAVQERRQLLRIPAADVLFVVVDGNTRPQCLIAELTPLPSPHRLTHSGACVLDEAATRVRYGHAARRTGQERHTNLRFELLHGLTH